MKASSFLLLVLTTLWRRLGPKSIRTTVFIVRLSYHHNWLPIPVFHFGEVK